MRFRFRGPSRDGGTRVPARRFPGSSDFHWDPDSRGMIGRNWLCTTAKSLAGAVGLEPTPSSLTVRCPTNWTTPQQFRTVLSNPLKINIVRKTRKCAAKELFRGFRRKSRFGPGAPPAVHGNAIRVAHFLQVIRGERGTETAAAIEDQRRGLVRNRLFDVAFDHSLAEMNSARQVATRPLVVFAHIHESEFFSGVQPLLYLSKIQFFHASLRVIDNRQKSRRMFHIKYPPRGIESPALRVAQEKNK